MQRPSASMKSLLRLAALGPVEWLSGADQAAVTTVHWISLDVDAARPGDVLLLPGRQVKADLMRRVTQQGVSALILDGSLPDGETLAGWELPVARLDSQEELETVYRTLLTLLIDQRAHLIAWGNEIHTRLDHLVAEGVGLNGLAQTMTEISGRGVVVQDKRLKVMASCASPPLQAVWSALTVELQDSDRLPEPLRDRKKAGKSHRLLRQEMPGGLSRLVTSISVGGVARGYLSLIGLEGDLDDLDHVLLEQGALACAVQMSRSKAVRETEKRLHGDLLTALLQEELSPRDARLWAQAMELNLNLAHVALRFAWDMAEPPTLRRLETLINGEVSHHGLTAIVNRMVDEVICFCQVPVESGAPAVALDLGQRVLARARQEDPGRQVLCGLGSPASDLGNWRVSFRQAGQALEMARRLQADRPLYFPDLSVYRLLLQIEGSPELLDFRDEILNPLLAYETGEELIRTLKAYFEHNGNLSQTADALFIHRNSLLYRMARIAEITGLDLDNPETRLAVQLALHIHHMSGSQLHVGKAAR